MRTANFAGCPALTAFCFLGIILGPGCRPSPPAVEPNSTQVASTLPTAPREEAADQEVDAITIPDGTPEELFQFLGEVETREFERLQGPGSESLDPEARGQAMQRLMLTRVRVCDTILEKEIPADIRASAIQMKLDALRTLAAIQPDQWKEPFDRLCAELIDGKDAYLARFARATRYQAQVNDFISEADGDEEALRVALGELLQNPDAGAETFRAARDASGWLMQTGRYGPAMEALTMIGKRFQDDANEDLATEAQKLASQSVNLQLSQLARNVLDEKPQAIDDLLTTMRSLLQSNAADPNLLAYLMQTAQMLEYAGYTNGAGQAYDLIRDDYPSEPDSQTAQDVQRTVDLAHQRLDLIGQPLEIEGVLLDGSAFDWQTYRGKPVFVCFWTTWYENWLQDVSQIRQALRDYPPDAVAVVTINLDDDRNTLERYLQTHPLPWPVVVHADPMAAGFENPNAVRCGVEAVPLAILVDADGVVTDLHVLGGRLSKVLAERLTGSPSAQ